MLKREKLFPCDRHLYQLNKKCELVYHILIQFSTTSEGISIIFRLILNDPNTKEDSLVLFSSVLLPKLN